MFVCIAGWLHDHLRSVSPCTCTAVSLVQGAYAYDVDGNKYIDYVGTWGPAICGHANPEAISLALSLTSAS